MRIAITLLAFGVTSVAFAQSPQEKAVTIKFLQELQVADGGFVPAPTDGRLDTNPRGGLRATSAALRALKYFGGGARDKTSAARFVASCYDAKIGGFSEQPGGTPDVFTSAIGLMAAVELEIASEDMRKAVTTFMTHRAKEFEEIRMTAAGLEAAGMQTPRANEWIRQVMSKANEDGSFGRGAERPRATGGTVAMILRLGGKVNDPAKIIAILNSGQSKDGGFAKDDGPPDLETTYRVMRCYHMLKAEPTRADDLRKLLAKCRNSDGGYGVQPEKPSNVSGTYYAGIILKWLGDH